MKVQLNNMKQKAFCDMITSDSEEWKIVLEQEGLNLLKDAVLCKLVNEHMCHFMVSNRSQCKGKQWKPEIPEQLQVSCWM